MPKLTPAEGDEASAAIPEDRSTEVWPALPLAASPLALQACCMQKMIGLPRLHLSVSARLPFYPLSAFRCTLSLPERVTAR